MIEFIKSWANQIIVAVIISTIIEMILPSGNNKKYIKIIIGLYVLFTIIQPIIIKVTGESIDISDFNYKKYFNEDVLETSIIDFENNNSKLIKQAYIDNIKEDVKNKIKKKGYEVIECSIDIEEDQYKDTYGEIQSIIFKIGKQEKEVEVDDSRNIINIENIDINISNSTSDIDTNSTKKLELSENEKIEIIEYLSEEYSIQKKNIVIN